MPTLTEKAVELIAYLDKNAKPEPKPNEPPTISELLAQSRAQHLIYRRSLRHRANGVTVEGNATAAAEAVSHSARLRAQAEIRDPKHEDPAWAEDLAAKFPHDALVTFYEDEVKYYVPLAPERKPVDVIEEPKQPAEDVKIETVKPKKTRRKGADAVAR